MTKIGDVFSGGSKIGEVHSGTDSSWVGCLGFLLLPLLIPIILGAWYDHLFLNVYVTYGTRPSEAVYSHGALNGEAAGFVFGFLASLIIGMVAGALLTWVVGFVVPAVRRSAPAAWLCSLSLD